MIESLVTGNREMYREHGSFNNFAKWAQKLLAWSAGAVILLNLRMLYQLYNYNAGLSRMKALARSYVLWPDIDRDIEQIVRNCQECQLNSNSSKKMPVHPWEWNGKCKYCNKTCLIVVDSFSKWMDIIPTTNATSEETTEKLWIVFTSFGLPEEIMMENGSWFTSFELEKILQQNEIE